MNRSGKTILLIFLFIAVTTSLHAQIATVGTTLASKNDGSNQWSVALSPVAGDSLLVGCNFNSGISFVGISDTAGDTFTLIGPEADSSEFAARAYLATNVKGGSTTVTCTAASSAPNNEIYVTELKGVSASAPVDKVLSVAGSTPTASGSVTTTNANEFLWAYIISGRVTNASGWTSLSTYDSNLTTSRTLAAPATVQASFPVTADWTLVLAALNPAAVGAAPPMSVSVSPPTASVQVSQSSSFTAALQNDSQNKGVTWSMSGAGCSGATCGSLSSVTSTSVTYTAPTALPSPATVTLLATSVTDSTKSAAATLSITAPPPISVSVSPATATVQVSQSSSFTATLQNDSQNKGVTWKLSGAGCSGATCGSLSNVTSTSVTFIAPTVVPNPASVTLTATSVADQTKSGASAITIAALASQSTITTVGTTAASKNDGSKQWSVAVSPLATDTLLVGCDFNSGISFVGVSDTSGDTFTLIGPETDSPNFSARAYLATNVKGGSTTVTCTAASAAPNNEIYVTELKGVNPAAPVDKILSLEGSTSSATSSITTTNANEFLWAYLISGSVTNASGWTSLSNFDDNLVTSRTVPMPASIQANFPVTLDWTLITVALNPNGAGVPSPAISVSIAPTNPSVQPSGSVSFTATLQNDTQNKGVTWSLSGAGCSGTACGSLSNLTSTSVTYTAPATQPSPASVSLAATSIADTTKSASATVTLSGGSGLITVAVSPALAEVTLSQLQQFSAAVNNDPQNLGVTWAVDGNTGGNSTTGTITPTGLFTPGTQPGLHAITAASVANANDSASASIAVTDLTGVFTHHYDPQRTGQNLKEYALAPSTVSSATFGSLFSCSVNEGGSVPGYTYAQPLYVANLLMPDNKKHNVVFVATESDFVYAFDADANPCQQLWKASMLDAAHGAAVGATTVPDGDTGETGDPVPEIGITSTPVIDPSTNTIYVCSKTKEPGPVYVHRLHALDLTTGAEKFGGPATISANGFEPLMHLQRPALLLNGGTVYVSFGSHGDHNTYHGWVMGYSTSTLVQTFVWASTDLSSNTEGAIWGAGAGPAVDSSGNVWVETANGDFDGSINYGDSVVKLSSTGALLDFFTPSYQDTLRANDVDLGSGGVLILPDSVGSTSHPHLAVATGKPGGFFLLDQTNLGKFNSSSDNDVQEVFPQGVNTATVGAGVFGVTAYWNGNLYISVIGDNLRVYPIASGLIAANSASNSSHSFSFPGAVPVISANGASGGIVWATEIGGYTPGSPAILYALDATNLANQLYVSPSSGSAAAGNAVKFTVPTVANGKVYVAGQGQLTVFGLFPQ